MPLSTPISGNLIDFNVGLAAAVGFINPLSAQLDALLAGGLGPFQADIAANLNASLAAQATLTLQVSDPLASLKLAIAAVAQLQAALTAALAFPPVTLSVSAELVSSIALAGALSAKLGLIKALIQAALSVKLGAVKAAADLTAHLNAGPAFAFSFSGDTLGNTGTLIQGLFASGLSQGGNTILPSEVVTGVVLLTKVPSVSASLSAIITT